MRKVFYCFLVCAGMLFADCQPDAHLVNIRAAIERQLAAYPESTLQDVYKSFYQEHFGPEHMIADTVSVQQYLLMELAESDVASEVYFEPVGSEGRYVRVYLSAVADGLVTTEQLLEAFIRSANSEQPPLPDWKTEWETVVSVIQKHHLKVNDFDTQLPALTEAAQNRQAVHHSQPYREAYHPHYRIVEQGIFEREFRPLIEN